MAKYTLDMFKQVLPNLDRHNLDYYSTLDEDQKKGFAGITAMRFMSVAPGQAGDWYVMAVNQRANVRFWEMYEHPELQWKLLASNGIGQPVNHSWVKGPGAVASDKLTDFILRFWPMANNMEVQTILGQFTPDTFADFVDGTGVDTNEAKQFKAAFKARHGI